MYFLLANLVAIPVMLMVGTVADQIGIAEVIMGVVLFLTVIAAITTYQAFRFRGVAGGIYETGTAIEYHSRPEDE